MPSPEDRSPLDSTASLLTRGRQGDRHARDDLFARYLPRLRALAHGRLPRGAQGPADTDDLVQLTLYRALSHLDGFVPQRPGSFYAYLRQIMLNQVRDMARRARARPTHVEVDGTVVDNGLSPLERAVGRDMLDRYDKALARLEPDQREAVVMRIEMGFSYDEIAEALERPSATAARLLIQRALVRLARDMHEYR